MKSSGDLEYKPVKLGEDDLKAMALRQRPDVRAAQLGMTAAQSQFSLAKANGKRDVNAQVNYTHVADLNTASLFGSIQLPIFDRNQGEIARTRYAITQSQELSSEQSSHRAHRRGQLVRIASHQRSSRAALSVRLSESRPRIRATSASTPTSAAPPACSIFWTPSAAIARPSLPTGKPSPVT